MPAVALIIGLSQRYNEEGGSSQGQMRHKENVHQAGVCWSYRWIAQAGIAAFEADGSVVRFAQQNEH